MHSQIIEYDRIKSLLEKRKQLEAQKKEIETELARRKQELEEAIKADQEKLLFTEDDLQTTVKDDKTAIQLAKELRKNKFAASAERALAQTQQARVVRWQTELKEATGKQLFDRVMQGAYSLNEKDKEHGKPFVEFFAGNDSHAKKARDKLYSHLCEIEIRDMFTANDKLNIVIKVFHEVFIHDTTSDHVWINEDNCNQTLPRNAILRKQLPYAEQLIDSSLRQTIKTNKDISSHLKKTPPTLDLINLAIEHDSHISLKNIIDFCNEHKTAELLNERDGFLGLGQTPADRAFQGNKLRCFIVLAENENTRSSCSAALHSALQNWDDANRPVFDELVKTGKLQVKMQPNNLLGIGLIGDDAVYVLNHEVSPLPYQYFKKFHSNVLVSSADLKDEPPPAAAPIRLLDKMERHPIPLMEDKLARINQELGTLPSEAELLQKQAKLEGELRAAETRRNEIVNLIAANNPETLRSQLAHFGDHTKVIIRDFHLQRYAATIGSEKALEVLLELTDEHDKNAFFEAAKANQVNCLRVLRTTELVPLKQREEWFAWAVQEAVRQKHTRFIESLCKQNIVIFDLVDMHTPWILIASYEALQKQAETVAADLRALEWEFKLDNPLPKPRAYLDLIQDKTDEETMMRYLTHKPLQKVICDFVVLPDRGRNSIWKHDITFQAMKKAGTKFNRLRPYIEARLTEKHNAGEFKQFRSSVAYIFEKSGNTISSIEQIKFIKDDLLYDHVDTHSVTEYVAALEKLNSEEMKAIPGTPELSKQIAAKTWVAIARIPVDDKQLEPLKENQMLKIALAEHFRAVMGDCIALCGENFIRAMHRLAHIREPGTILHNAVPDGSRYLGIFLPTAMVYVAGFKEPKTLSQAQLEDAIKLLLAIQKAYEKISYPIAQECQALIKKLSEEQSRKEQQMTPEQKIWDMVKSDKANKLQTYLNKKFNLNTVNPFHVTHEVSLAYGDEYDLVRVEQAFAAKGEWFRGNLHPIYLEQIAGGLKYQVGEDKENHGTISWDSLGLIEENQNLDYVFAQKKNILPSILAIISSNGHANAPQEPGKLYVKIEKGRIVYRVRDRRPARGVIVESIKEILTPAELKQKLPDLKAQILEAARQNGDIQASNEPLVYHIIRSGALKCLRAVIAYESQHPNEGVIACLTKPYKKTALTPVQLAFEQRQKQCLELLLDMRNLFIAEQLHDYVYRLIKEFKPDPARPSLLEQYFSGAPTDLRVSREEDSNLKIHFTQERGFTMTVSPETPEFYQYLQAKMKSQAAPAEKKQTELVAPQQVLALKKNIGLVFNQLRAAVLETGMILELKKDPGFIKAMIEHIRKLDNEEDQRGALIDIFDPAQKGQVAQLLDNVDPSMMAPLKTLYDAYQARDRVRQHGRDAVHSQPAATVASVRLPRVDSDLDPDKEFSSSRSFR